MNFSVASQTKLGDGGSGGLPGGTLADSDFFGRSVTHLGDIDAAGMNECIVGVPEFPDGFLDRGAVYILFSPGGPESGLGV